MTATGKLFKIVKKGGWLSNCIGEAAGVNAL